jgi:predicted NACHT family NTPase
MFAVQCRELLRQGGLILLDGLDEVPDPSARREQIKQAVQGFADTFSSCRFLVTSRS